MTWTIEYYETESGKIPAYDFIHNLPIKMRTKAFQELKLLQELGTKITLPYARPMQNGLYELRVQFASDISRIFYFFYVGNKIILTNGFVKKTQKTPRNEIEKALQYKQDYERRNQNDT